MTTTKSTEEDFAQDQNSKSLPVCNRSYANYLRQDCVPQIHDYPKPLMRCQSGPVKTVEAFFPFQFPLFMIFVLIIQFVVEVAQPFPQVFHGVAFSTDDGL